MLMTRTPAPVLVTSFLSLLMMLAPAAALSKSFPEDPDDARSCRRAGQKFLF